jgi:hypothetical protein
MSERAQRSWTPERRAEQSAKAKAQFEAWRSDHPDRAAVVDQVWADVESGSLVRPLCADCGRPMHPIYDWEVLARTGWRCRSGHTVVPE